MDGAKHIVSTPNVALWGTEEDGLKQREKKRKQKKVEKLVKIKKRGLTVNQA